MNGPRQTQKRHSGFRVMAAATARLRAKQSVCRTIATRCEAVIRRARDAWPEWIGQRRHIDYSEADDGARMAWQAITELRSPRTGRGKSSLPNPTRFAARLFALGADLVSTRLRSIKAGCSPRLLLDDRLDEGRDGRGQAERGEAGAVEASPKNNFGSPATGRSFKDRPAMGRSAKRETPENAHFVPPRDKTPLFLMFERPATGHLYRLAICRTLSESLFFDVKERAGHFAQTETEQRMEV